jgi:hypothetical protein
MICPSCDVEPTWCEDPFTPPDGPDGFFSSPAVGFDITLFTVFIDFQV